MKNYSSNRAQKGKTAYRTPSRWLSGRPEAIKRTKYNNRKNKNTGNSSHFTGRHT